MRRACWTCAVLALVVIGCNNGDDKQTVKPMTPAQRDKACAAIAAADRNAGTKKRDYDKARQNCLKVLDQMPPAESNALVECLLKPNANFKACAAKSSWVRSRLATKRKQVRANLMRMRDRMARDELKFHAAQIVALKRRNHKLPGSLAEIEKATGKPLLDARNRPLRYTPKGKGFTLCSDGTDGKPGTADDLCVSR